MIRRIIFGILIMLKTFSITAQTGNEVSGELIVQFANWEDHYNAIYNINSKHNWPLTGMRILNHGWQIAILYYDTTKIERRQLIGLLYNEPQIVNAQSNHRLQLRVTPNDPNYSMQWNMFNDGSGGGIADADIDAAEAWDLVTGGVTANGDTIVIAVVDDGFALNHEDLSFFKNYDEIPLNEIDDDGNGYIDDFDGWNSAEENGEIPSFNHGTHVSGIAGAVGNNGIGVAGVNWNVKILPVRSQVIESQVIASYAYIYEMRKLYDETDGEKGAFIVATNSSFGIDFVFPEEYPLWCAMYDSLGRLGILSAAATNNSMTNIDVVGDMPTGCTSDHMIGVTSTDKADNLKAGYGPVNIDLGAPGSLIESTFPGNTYGLQSGTSMASPHVAGTIALMFDAACEKFLEDYAFDPAGMSLLLKQYLLESVDVLDDLASVTVSGGRLNAYNAINQLLAGYCDTSIDDLPAGGDILVYPNPATSDIQIIGFDEQQQFGELIIWDISGRRIYSSNEFTGDISVADFHEGIYLLQVTDDNSEIIFTSAFIVQH